MIRYGQAIYRWLATIEEVIITQSELLLEDILHSLWLHHVFYYMMHPFYWIFVLSVCQFVNYILEMKGCVTDPMERLGFVMYTIILSSNSNSSCHVFCMNNVVWTMWNYFVFCSSAMYCKRHQRKHQQTLHCQRFYWKMFQGPALIFTVALFLQSTNETLWPNYEYQNNRGDCLSAQRLQYRSESGLTQMTEKYDSTKVFCRPKQNLCQKYGSNGKSLEFKRYPGRKIIFSEKTADSIQQIISYERSSYYL